MRYTSLLRRFRPLLGLFTFCLLLQFQGLLFSTPGHAATLWGPVLGHVTPTAATISWRDDGGKDGVEFNGVMYKGAVRDGYHSVVLNDLRENSAYTYTFLHGKTRDNYAFHTAPSGPAEFTFVAYGDTRAHPEVHRRIVAAMNALHPRFVINTGDLVGEGHNTSLWDSFFAVTASLTGSAPYYAAPGNHENNADYFFHLFTLPNNGGSANEDHYSATYGDVDIVVLNSTRHLQEQRTWLAQHLAAMKGKTTWTVVAFHYPPFSTSSRNGDANIRKYWVPVLEQYKVDVVFLGHDHFYERSEKSGVQYFICGGGGAPLYTPDLTNNPYRQHTERTYHYMRVDVTPASMRLRMYRVDGSIGDEVTLTKPAAQRPQPQPVASRVMPMLPWLPIVALYAALPTAFISRRGVWR